MTLDEGLASSAAHLRRDSLKTLLDALRTNPWHVSLCTASIKAMVSLVKNSDLAETLVVEGGYKLMHYLLDLHITNSEFTGTLVSTLVSLLGVCDKSALDFLGGDGEAKLFDIVGRYGGEMSDIRGLVVQFLKSLYSAEAIVKSICDSLGPEHFRRMLLCLRQLKDPSETQDNLPLGPGVDVKEVVSEIMTKLEFIDVSSMPVVVRKEADEDSSEKEVTTPPKTKSEETDRKVSVTRERSFDGLKWDPFSAVRGVPTPRTGTSLRLVRGAPKFPTPHQAEEPTYAPEDRGSGNAKGDARNMNTSSNTLHRVVFDSVEPCQQASAQRGEKVLNFESRFESANLRRAIQVYENEYDLILNPDFNTNGNTQWYFFMVSNTTKGVKYKFNIINLLKNDSLYNYGMKPLLYSVKSARRSGQGWIRTGTNISYYRNHIKRSQGNYHTLSFTIDFPHDDDSCFLAYCYPYTYTDLMEYLSDIEQDKRGRARHCKKETMCFSLANNEVPVLTITEGVHARPPPKSRKGIILTARVHPGESNASWMMKGTMDFLLSEEPEAVALRENFVFRIVPMLNPDGVINGNYRCSLAGVDLNRQWANPDPKKHPTVYNTKLMIKSEMLKREVVLYCDMHGHSKKKNIFMYGNENHHGEMVSRERIFPVLLSKTTDMFSLSDSCFKVRKDKESTARVVVWKELGIINSFTIEASFCGPNIGANKDCHFNIGALEEMGRAMCRGALEIWGPKPNTEEGHWLHVSNDELMSEAQGMTTDSEDDGSDAEFESAPKKNGKERRRKSTNSEKSKRREERLSPESVPRRPKRSSSKASESQEGSSRATSATSASEISCTEEERRSAPRRLGRPLRGWGAPSAGGEGNDRREVSSKPIDTDSSDGSRPPSEPKSTDEGSQAGHQADRLSQEGSGGAQSDSAASDGPGMSFSPSLFDEESSASQIRKYNPKNRAVGRRRLEQEQSESDPSGKEKADDASSTTTAPDSEVSNPKDGRDASGLPSRGAIAGGIHIGGGITLLDRRGGAVTERINRDREVDESAKYKLLSKGSQDTGKDSYFAGMSGNGLRQSVVLPSRHQRSGQAAVSVAAPPVGRSRQKSNPVHLQWADKFSQPRDVDQQHGLFTPRRGPAQRARTGPPSYIVPHAPADADSLVISPRMRTVVSSAAEKSSPARSSRRLRNASEDAFAGMNGHHGEPNAVVVSGGKVFTSTVDTTRKTSQLGFRAVSVGSPLSSHPIFTGSQPLQKKPFPVV